jgi:hypothetical protein
MEEKKLHHLLITKASLKYYKHFIFLLFYFKLCGSVIGSVIGLLSYLSRLAKYRFTIIKVLAHT